MSIDRSNFFLLLAVICIATNPQTSPLMHCILATTALGSFVGAEYRRFRNGE